MSEKTYLREINHIDLHLHTHRSDGSFSPTEVVELAKKNQVDVISITDHDTLSGLEEASTKAAQLGIGFIPGVEISAKSPSGVLHILAYGIDPKNKLLSNVLEEYQLHRNGRNHKIIDILKEQGIDITYEDLVKKAGDCSSIGRPHIAMLLLERGAAKDFNDAFTKYLSRKGSAYVEKEFFTAKEAIHIIHEAGGFAIMAHPTSLRMGMQDLNDYLDQLKLDGLDGLEVSSSAHNGNFMKKLNLICDRLDFLRTSGSDFHGASKPHVQIGRNQDGKRIKGDWVSFAIKNLAQ